MGHEWDQDEYGEILNGPMTYSSIADILRSRDSIVIGWTDQEFTHLDILFCLRPDQAGSLQRGMHGPSDLFVAISGFGMHGFGAEIELDTHPSYIGEKLGLGRGVNKTTEGLADLIDGVRRAL